MSSIDEKRVYGSKEGKTDVFVAGETGVVCVECSGDLVGGFGLVHRCRAADVAASQGRLAVATDEDVFVWRDDEFVPTAFGSASAVGFHDTLIAAGARGVARDDDGDWSDLGTLDCVRAIDGDLLATGDGVYRVGDGLTAAGLTDVRDVSRAGGPLAATATGLYRLANGWVDVLAGDVHLVTSDGTRAHAASEEALYAREDGEWASVSLPVDERIAGVGYGESTYAVTVDGTFLVETENGWRTQSLGVPGVYGLAVA